MHAFLRSNQKITLWLGLTTFFALIYAANNALTGFLLLVPGAHLVHIPSGFKLLMVLICGWSAATGIALVSFIAGFYFFFEGQFLVSLLLAFVNASVPLLTSRFFIDHLSLDSNLANLNWHRIVGLSFFYSALNSTTNQLVLYYTQPNINFFDGLLVMFVGDITGILIVLTLCRPLARRLVILLPPTLVEIEPTESNRT